MVAAIRTTFGNAMVKGDLLADFAVNAVRIKMVFEPFQTDIIVGKLPLKILDRVLGKLRGFRFHALTLPQSYLLSRDNYERNNPAQLSLRLG
jgi:hypothetical protein